MHDALLQEYINILLSFKFMYIKKFQFIELF